MCLDEGRVSTVAFILINQRAWHNWLRERAGDGIKNLEEQQGAAAGLVVGLLRG